MVRLNCTELVDTVTHSAPGGGGLELLIHITRVMERFGSACLLLLVDLHLLLLGDGQSSRFANARRNGAFKRIIFLHGGARHQKGTNFITSPI